jgi:hypothetical protein
LTLKNLEVMKKFTFLKSLLLTVALLAGNVGAWAQTCDISDDFTTLTASSSYASVETTAHWKGTNTAVLQGGTTNSNPTFTFIGSDATTKALCINGKTTAVGVITSPTLSGGCASISFKYGHPFGESNGAKFTVEIQQNGTTVWSDQIVNTSMTQFTAYTYSKTGLSITGDFTVVITNNSPSASTSNKDRVAIWGICIGNYSGGTPTVANPTFTVTGTIKSTDVYWNSAKVSISSSTAGASIYYTLDGSEPTTSSTLYEGEITITTTTTIKAIAVKSGMNNSQISEKTITISAPATASLPFTEIFDGNLGDFYPFSKTGDQIWIASSYSSGTYTKFAKMSGYSGGNKENEDWLISPEFTPASASGITLTFASATNYNGPALQLKYSTNYDGFSDPSTATWTDITGSAAWPAEASSFAWVESGNVSIAGATPVRFAFVYTSTTEAAATWEVANVNVVNSAASATPTITVTEISVPEMSANVGKTDTETITVSGVNLTDNIILTISGANADQFSVSPSSIEPVSGTVTDASVTITYSPTVEGNHVAVLTLSSTGAEDVSLNLSGSATVSGLNPVVIKGVYARDGKIFVNAAVAGMNIEVYNTVGQRVASQVLKGDLNIIPVSTKGVLLVKCGSEVTKVILP